MTLSKTKLCHYAECHCAECLDLSIGMLNVTMLSVVWLSVVRLSVFMLNVVMLSVIAPKYVIYFSLCHPFYSEILYEYCNNVFITNALSNLG